MNRILILLIPLLIAYNSFSQQKTKLVVGIVVDQLRYDYIYRFWDQFDDNGFKKLINDGHFYRNCQFGYAPTYTGPGHASIYTGTTPSSHGIIANNWFDKTSGKSIYCAGDGDMHTVCNCDQVSVDIQSNDGKMSPHHMLTTTFSDELKLFSNESKVIGISLKDRGAILPAGHTANAAYWMDSDGKWITSSYYMNQLPQWVENENNTDKITKYMSGIWKVKNEFSHNLDTLLKINGRSSIKKTPFGNSILNDFAIRAIKEESLGKDETTDCLFISYSSTDYIGHQYGPHAPEIMDTYIRLDQDIAKLLQTIDSKVGYENTILFLTSDHGVAIVPNELIERRIPAGYYNSNLMIEDLKVYLQEKYNWPNKENPNEYISDFSNNQLFLNNEFINNNLDVNIKEIRESCAEFILDYEWVKNTFTSHQLHENEYQNSFHSLFQNGYNQKRSGDVIVSPQSGWLSSYWEKGGTTHGTAYNYDTHIPLIFWGGNINKGKTDRQVNIRDIAPTISILLGISYPSGCTGNPLIEISQ